ncbi:MAG: IS3 family transposase [Alcanivorax sp.]|nr:IS3 family transposase [Alcanivorax sp.]
MTKESLFARFKFEALYAEDVKSKQEAHSYFFEYIELFYNSHRRAIKSRGIMRMSMHECIPKPVSAFSGEDQSRGIK